MKKCSKYRACDAEENGLQVDGVVRRHHPVRSDWNLKRRLFLIKNALFLGRLRKKSVAYRALLCECKEKFLKITTVVDTRNSKNSKRILFIALELY